MKNKRGRRGRFGREGREVELQREPERDWTAHAAWKQIGKGGNKKERGEKRRKRREKKGE